MKKRKKHSDTFPGSHNPLATEGAETSPSASGEAERSPHRKKKEEALLHSPCSFELLASTASDLLQARKPLEAVESVCRRVMAHLDCHIFFNFLAEEKAGKLRLNAFAGIPEEEARRIEWLEYGVAACGCAARDGRRVVVEHIPSTSDERTELVRPYGIKACAAHPLKGPGGKIIGTLLFGTRSRETFSEEDLSLMNAVTDQVAMAMNRMKDEEALRESEERLTLAASGTRIGIFDWNLKTGEIAATEQKIRLYGMDLPTTTTLSQRYTYRDWAERFHPEDLPRVEAEMDRCMAEHAPFESEYRVVWPDGSVHWLAARGLFQYDDQDVPARFIGIVMDITDRKQAEIENRELAAAIQQEKDKLQVLVSSIPDEVWFTDKQKKLVLINPYVTRKFGISGLGMEMGAGCVEVFRPDGTPRPVEDSPPLRALRGETVEHQEEIVRIPKTGELYHLQMNAAPVKDFNGDIIGSVCVARDITAQKQAEKELTDTKAMLEMFLTQAPLGFSYMDRDLRFLMINSPLAEMNGLPVAAHLGRTVAEIVPTLLPDVEKVIARILATGEPVMGHEFSGETPLKPGVKRYWNESWYPVYDPEGQVTGFGVIVEEITERKRTEEQLQALLEEKDILLRELSHRTKNNLQVIISLLGMQASKSKDERMAEALSDAQDRVRTLALVYEKLHRSGSVSSLHVDRYVKELVTTFLHAHQGIGGTVQSTLDLEEMEISHDQALPVGLILNELLSNSVKHAFLDGKAGNILVSIKRLGETMELRYRDNGPGVPKGMDLSGGSSLGLKLVYNLAVRQLLGTVELVPGPGAEIVFRVPMQKIESNSLRYRGGEPVATK